MPTPNLNRFVATYQGLGRTPEEALLAYLAAVLEQPVPNDDPPANPITEQAISALEGGTRLDWLP